MKYQQFELEEIKLPNLVSVQYVGPSVCNLFMQKVNHKYCKIKSKLTYNEIYKLLETNTFLVVNPYCAVGLWGIIFQNFNDFKRCCILSTLRLDYLEDSININIFIPNQETTSLLNKYKPKKIVHEWTDANLYLLPDGRILLTFGYDISGHLFKNLLDFERYYREILRLEKLCNEDGE